MIFNPSILGFVVSLQGQFFENPKTLYIQISHLFFKDPALVPFPFNDDDEEEFLGFTEEQIEAARLREEMKKMEYMQEREKDRHYFQPG